VRKILASIITVSLLAQPAISAIASENLASLARPVARGPLAGESIYFVMTDRFANGDTSNDNGGLIGSRSQSGFDPSDKAYFHGGDLKGLTQHLQYIKDLGFTSIWITPPVKNQYVQGTSAAYHGYWGVDFSTIDPHLGTEEDFRNFVSDAHALGLKVIVDIVVNHTADIIKYTVGKYGYRYLMDYPYKDCQGKAFELYKVAGSKNFPKLCTTKSFAYIPTVDPWNQDIKKPAFLNDLTNYHNRGDSTFTGTSVYDGDFFGLDDVFTEKPEVVKGWSDLWASWITRFNIDGYRVDTAKHVNPEFWNVFIPKMLAIAKSVGKKDFPIFGEVAESDAASLATFVKEQSFQSVLDFGFQNNVTRFVVTGSGLDGLVGYFNADDFYTSSTTSAYSLATFLGNHDMGRIGQFIADSNLEPAEALGRAQLANALLFTLRGSPILYYGDEKGFTGTGGDQLARQDFFPTLLPEWQSERRIGSEPIGTASSFDVANPLGKTVAALNRLVQSEPALKAGAQQIRYAREGVFAYSRYANNQEYLIVANGVNDITDVRVPVSTLDSEWEVMLGVGTAKGDGAFVDVSLPDLGWVILKANKKYQPKTTPSISIDQPENDYSTHGWTLINANVPGDDYIEVTFSARIPGKKWIIVGTADRRTFDPGRNFRVFMYDKIFKPGSKIEIVAVARNAAGKIAVSRVIKWKTY
jgi:glycosidase